MEIVKVRVIIHERSLAIDPYSSPAQFRRRYSSRVGAVPVSLLQNEPQPLF